MDYRQYHCSRKETLCCLAVSLAVTVVICWLFYRSWYAMALAVPVYFAVKKRYKQEQLRKRKKGFYWNFVMECR